MNLPSEELDLLTLAESVELECKAAQGRDGRGELPEDFWKSYSAMANTEGGLILLGVQEKPRGQFRALGLADPERVRKALWDNLHNRKQISLNLLSDADVAPVAIEGRTVLRIRVPRATRQQRPIHLGSNPLGGTYLRRHEGDYPADDEAVRRLLAERVEDSRDERVLQGFDFGDLDMDTVAAYRNRFAAVKPGHVWTDLPLPEFLERIGAFGKNRETGQRVEDTPVHEALREALANTLIHADYSGRVSVLVVKRPDMFGFRNPGHMRIAPALAIQGGNSDCRNRRLQTMFQLVGYGDHAGSGLPKIYSNWAGQHWRAPLLTEAEPEQTLMQLRMSSLVPEHAVEALTARLGERFTALPEIPRLALITAQVEGLVSHERLKHITVAHSADLTKMLGALVREGLLLSEGAGRGTLYRLPWQRIQAPSMLFEDERGVGQPPEQPHQPLEQGLKPPELEAKPLEQPGSALYLHWADVPTALQAQLLAWAAPVREAGKVRQEITQATVVQLCTGRYLGRQVLAHLLNRHADDLWRRFLNPMVTQGQLKPAFPAPRDPRQAYTAAASAPLSAPLTP